ncbi:hypothetical protein ACFSTE_09415 [Aquimarina hainanensis]|uniref:Nuclease-related domain-containing protein n=1 Tax=Aquimarina hainanensis TaxID=1578017 RepID=A0ABW5N7X0_9FLAO
MTPSEQYIANLCEESFLPFWSHPNPLGKKGKELCDLLVVCENTIIIFSVKDIKVSEHQDRTIRYNRWVKNAVDSSLNQVFGAERYLNSVDNIKLKNRKTIVKLPPKKNRKIYRIAIAFGSEYDFPLPMGFDNRGFVHVFDEKSTAIIISELDTITDFTRYLEAKEKFLESKYMLLPEETDLLALYIQTGLQFDYPVNLIAGSNGLWATYEKSEDYKNWREQIKPSFIWDYMIKQLFDYHIDDNTNDETRNSYEEAVRLINQESRINRIELGISLDNAIKRKVNARILLIPDSTYLYIFMPLSSKNWKDKELELELRCVVAKYLNPNVNTFIGIAIGNDGNNKSVFDIGYFHFPELSDEFIKLAKTVQKEYGYFNNPKFSKSSLYRDEKFNGFGL